MRGKDKQGKGERKGQTREGRRERKEGEKGITEGKGGGKGGEKEYRIGVWKQRKERRNGGERRGEYLPRQDRVSAADCRWIEREGGREG